MSKTIRIGNEVESYLKEHGRFGESPDDVIKRSLMKMYKVNIFTCLKDEESVFMPLRIFSRTLDLPFMPQVGMSFHQGISTEIWEPVYSQGEGKLPVVEQVFWDLDEDMFVVRMSDIEKELESTFWREPKTEPEISYFCHYIDGFHDLIEQ